jgi:high affinity sulfate transporter 1
MGSDRPESGAIAAGQDVPEARPAIASFLPILGWIRTYDWSNWLRLDFLAGLTIAAFSVPESMAYASLAGLDPQYGLYASMIALLVYTFFGTSRQMSVGTTSALAIMVGGTLGTMAFADQGEYLAAAQVTALMAGGIAIAAGLLKLGFIVNFISESVLKGFSAGAALFIASSQLSKLFGIEGVEGNFFERVWNVIENIGDTNGWSLGLGLASIAALLVLEEKLPKLPGSLIVVLAAIAIMAVSDLEDRGVAIAGDIPRGLPSLGISDLPSGVYSELWALAFGIFLLSYLEGIGVARTFAAKYREKIDANQEMIANGAINIATGLTKGFPVGGSMSRSAVSDASGARTPLAGGIAGLLLAIVVLFLTGLFEQLPETTLAAVVLVAVKGLIDIPGLKRLFNLSRMEFLAAMLTMLGVLTFDMLQGIFIGAGFSLLALAYRGSRPQIDVLGQVPGTDAFGSVLRHPEYEQVPGVLVTRVDGGIFYANVDAVQEHILDLVEDQPEPLKHLVFDFGNVPMLDIAGIDMLSDLKELLDDQGITLILVGTTGEVRDVLRSAGLGDLLGAEGPHETIEDVLAASDLESNRTG